MQRNGEHYERDHNGEAAGDEEDEEDEPQDKGKKKVSRAAAAAASQAALKDAGCRNQTGYIGVRQRKWGMFAAEIRDGDKRRWLGSFGSGREAGMAYDAAAISQKGSKAKTNFRYNDFSSAPRMDAETEEKVRWDLLPKDIAEKFPIPADPFGSGAGLDAGGEAHAAAASAAAAPTPVPAPPAPARRAPAPPAPAPEPVPEPEDLSNLYEQQRHSKRNRPNTTPSAAAPAPVAPPLAQPSSQPRASARYPAPYPPMVDGYGPDEEAHLAAMAAAASFYTYPAMYPHLDQDVYDAQVDAAAATAAYRHYGLMNGMHPGAVYDDPLAGMMPGPSMPPAPMRGSGSMGRERERDRERERERSSAKKRDYAQAEALHAGHMRQQPDEGGPDHSSRHARNGGKGPSSSRGAAAVGGGPASSRSAAHAASMAAAYDYALGVGAAHMGHPYAYTMAAGLPHYNSKAYMLAAPAFAGRYPGSDGGGWRGSPSRSSPYSPSHGGGPGSSGRQHSEAPGSHRSRLRHTDDNVAQPPASHGRGHSHGGGGGGDRSKSTSPRDPGPGYESHPSMMHYADIAATGYPGYEHMMAHPGYMPHHALYPGQYPALAAAAEPPPSLYTSTPGPTTGGTLVRPRAVHAKPEHAAVPGADALVGYLPGAFQPYHPAMGYRYHLDQAMLHSHYATLGVGPDDGPDDEDGDGVPIGVDEGPPRHRWRDAGGYQPEAGAEEMMAGAHHMGGSGAAPSRNGAADPPMLTGDHAAIVAAAAVSAQQQQEQEQQHGDRQHRR